MIEPNESMLDRADFGDRQAEMTARWFENVKRQHGDVDAYIATRHDAYLDRWKEAGRFIADGARVLDIGGGNLYERLIAYFVQKRFQYHYLDVDQAAVDGSRALAEGAGLTDSSFARGFNDKLDFPDGHFDAVFSSHCIEHSIDLATTFRELNRVIRADGNLLMAVPFGWETNPEHPYFLGPAEWVSLVEDAGFSIRVAQIGNEYPEIGEDYFIAARKVGPPSDAIRIRASDYLKDSYTYVSFRDPGVKYIGAFDHRHDCSISAAPDATVSITVPEAAIEIVPVLHRHPWSGIVRLSATSSTRDVDLYSWFTFDMPERVQLAAGTDTSLSISLIGKNPASRWAQYVFKGFYWR